MKLSKKWLTISLIITALVIVNGYLLLKNNNIILKSYYIHDVQFAQKDVQTEELTKSAAVVSNMEHYAAAPVNSIEEVFVVKGQSVAMSDPLATYKSDELSAASAEIETKIAAYENEVVELERILNALESEAGYPNTSTSTDGSSVKTTDWNLDLTVELGIEQNTPTAEGAAIIQRHIAESNREIEILNGQLNALNEDHSFIAPVDGIVSDIVLEGDMMTFIIQSSTKKLVTYVTKEEWLKIDLMQRATFTIFEGDEEREQLIDATVTAKQEIPARDSLGYEQLLARTSLSKYDVVYEVSLEPMDMLETTPLGEIVDVTIITNEMPDSYETYNDWIVNYEVDNLGSEHVYTVGYDGKTRLTPIVKAFDHQTVIHRELPAVVATEDVKVPAEEATEENVEEEVKAPPRIRNVELIEEQDEDETSEETEEEIVDATVFTASLEDTVLILDGQAKNIYAPIYRPLPIATFEKKLIGPFSWKDAVRYMLP